MHYRKRTFLAFVYGVLPLTLAVLMLLGWLLSLEKATTVLQTADSPDGRYRAEVVREDPGVSSSYKYMVRVMPAGLSPFAISLSGLPFDPVYVALDLHHQPDKLSVQWTSLGELTLQCDGCSGATHGKTNWRDLALRYQIR